MARKESPNLPSGLVGASALERKVQGELDKKMALFRKDKKVVKKPPKTVWEQTWAAQPGKVIIFDEYGDWKADYNPGDIPWRGNRVAYRVDNPFFDIHGKAKEALAVLFSKHPDIEIMRVEHPGMDATIFRLRKRGERVVHEVKISNTVMVQNDVDAIISIIEQNIRRAFYEGVPETQRTSFEGTKIKPPKSPTDEWADKWVKENK